MFRMAIPESQNRSALQAVAAHNPRGISGYTLAADGPVAYATEPYRD
jgi:hypothetical protein